LLVRAKVAADIRAFLPTKTKPAEVFEHRGDKLRAAPVAVEVFVAKDELAAVLLGTDLGGPESAGVSEV
jgi:hypothetical protein